MIGLFGKKANNPAQGAGEELHRLRQVLDNVDAMVMLADTTPDNVIFYMNKTARDGLHAHRAEMNARFTSGADVDQAFQHTIHQFHRDPGRIRKILADLASRKIPVHTAMIPVGSVMLETRVYPIWSQTDRNEVLCFMASFRDVSARVERERLASAELERHAWLQQSIDTLSQSIQGMSVTIESIATQTAAASQASEQIRGDTLKGVAVVDEASRSVQSVAGLVRTTADSLAGLGARSETIGNIVGVIKDIADQTNLLALNAAIEAARAGELGRGFAVVADEVRKLAERTAKATQEIGTMITDTQQDIALNVKSIEAGRREVETAEAAFANVVASLASVNEGIQQMRDFILQIAEASEEQAVTTQDISEKLQGLTEK